MASTRRSTFARLLAELTELEELMELNELAMLEEPTEVDKLTALELGTIEELLDTATELTELDIATELELDLDFPSPPHPVINSKTADAITP